MLFQGVVARRFTFVYLLVLLLSACGGNPYAEKIQTQYYQTQQSVLHLKTLLRDKTLSNTKIVAVYARQLMQLKPEFKVVAQALAKDATEKGVLFSQIVERLERVNKAPENKQAFEQASQALLAIDRAADPVIFNESLLDLINTMAELSGGKLASLSVPKRSTTENITAGSYLVGNPSYGQYRRDNTGYSVWHWYGQYAFFNRLIGGGRFNRGPIYYDDWNRRRHSSYYHDYGRNAYGSSRDRQQTSQRNARMRSEGHTPAKPKKQYGSVQGRQRVSSYQQQDKKRVHKAAKKQKSGARHAGKVKTQRSTNKRTVTKRRSSFLGASSARNSSRNTGGSRGFGGK